MIKEHITIPNSKVLMQTKKFVKDPSEKLALARFKAIELAEKLGNVAKACRIAGMDRDSFYKWRRRFIADGFEGLKDRPPVHKTHPMTTSEPVRQAVLELSKTNPSMGCRRISNELAKEKLIISPVTVQKILNKAGLGKLINRLLHLEEQALEGRRVTKEQLRLIERLNPCFRERHVESSAPGELVCQDTFYVGNFKGIGRVYLQTAVDTFGSYAFAMLATERNSTRAAELLYTHVMPFYEAHGLKLGAVLTDNGSEFCGNAGHPYESLLFMQDIDHRRTRPARPQTNGFVERFHRTILNEFFRVHLRQVVHESLVSLEKELQTWLVYYNTKRTHMGYRNRGATPYETIERYNNPVSQEG